MKQKQMVWVMIGLVLFAALSRVVLYPLHIYFSPVIAMALFGGACFTDKKYSFALPLLAMFFSDLMFEFFFVAPGFWGWGQLVNYAALLLVTFLGFALKKLSLLNIAAASVASSLIFFLVSNTGVWIFDTTTYARDLSGWIDCLVMGIPFLKNGLIADLSYATVLFGGYSLVTSRVVNATR
jgi:hypothetical protein